MPCGLGYDWDAASGERFASRRQKTERTGFEPVVEFYPHTGLANRSAVPVGGMISNGSDKSENVLAACLALLRRHYTDVAELIERWQGLPVPIRNAILTLVSGTTRH